MVSRPSGHRSWPCHNRPDGTPSRGLTLDIIFLLERLESQIATGTNVPLTGSVMVPREAILDLVDQLRVAIPEEVRAAKRINSEGERILEKAQEEASRILSRAQEQAAFLIEERGLTEAAEAESRRIVDEAQGAAEEVRRGADTYAAKVLRDLEDEVTKVIAGIRRGIEVLDDRRPAPAVTIRPDHLAAADEGDDRARGMARQEEDEDRDEGIRSLLR